MSERLFSAVILGLVLLVGYGHVSEAVTDRVDRMSACVDQISPATTAFCD